MKKIVKIILIVIIIILLYFLYIKMVKNHDINKIFGISILKITSGSMEPELNIGDIIIIKESNKYKVGDIITYKISNQYLITHRIINIYEDRVVTKGDYNNSEDSPIKIKDIQGKVIYHSRLLGVIYEYRIMIFLILLILIILL